MGKRKFKKNREFRNTPNGSKKYVWMLGGASIDIIATVGIFVLVNNAYCIPNIWYFYGILFLLLVAVVLGGELIGTYFGSMEQYYYDKNQKKVLDINE